MEFETNKILAAKIVLAICL